MNKAFEEWFAKSNWHESLHGQFEKCWNDSKEVAIEACESKFVSMSMVARKQDCENHNATVIYCIEAIKEANK